MKFSLPRTPDHLDRVKNFWERSIQLENGKIYLYYNISSIKIWQNYIWNIDSWLLEEELHLTENEKRMVHYYKKRWYTLIWERSRMWETPDYVKNFFVDYKDQIVTWEEKIIKREKRESDPDREMWLLFVKFLPKYNPNTALQEVTLELSSRISKALGKK